MVRSHAERQRAEVSVAWDVVRVSRNLTPADAEAGYRRGEFPMTGVEPGYVTWHRPQRRAILPLDQFHASRSLARTLKSRRFEVTFDQAFAQVMDACSDRPETWISPEFKSIYGQLHSAGKAHSVEVWVDGELAGGTYGVHMGGGFFAESKFHRKTDMSKVALAELVFHLRAQGFALLEVQYLTQHLSQFGVVEISAADYEQRLSAALKLSCTF